MSSSFNFIQIGSSDRQADTLRVEIWRTVNAVGNVLILLRNTGGKYNNTFDVQDTITVTVTDYEGNNSTILRGRVDGGNAVVPSASDNQDIWDEYITVRGVDRWQDILFHNDFEKSYPDSTNQIKDLLGDLFTAPKAIDTNIDYSTPAGATPVIGSVEFREGTNFLAGIQDSLQKAGWVSYVDDGTNLQAGAPGFSATGVILTNTGSDRNIIGDVELVEADGGKLYNWIKVKGKNPMFDGYTEENSSVWSSFAGTTLEDNTSNVKVGGYSQRVYNNAAAANIMRHELDLPAFNYSSFDFTKGEIGFWGYYDNQAGGGGTPGAGSAGTTEPVMIRLIDSAGGIVSYYGESTRLYRGEWGWVSAKLGEKTENTGVNAADKWWYLLATGNFDWSNVVSMYFQIPNQASIGLPSNFYIDGITLPLPVIGIAENAAAQTTYRKRPLPISMTNLSAHNSVQQQADQLLAQHEATNISYLKLMVKGNLNLHYAGQSYTVNIPELGLNNSIFYSTSIHHVIEPRVDVSDGYGFDFITEVEGSPVFGVAYDMSRLGDRQVYSATQLSQFGGTGLGIK